MIYRKMRLHWQERPETDSRETWSALFAGETTGKQNVPLGHLGSSSSRTGGTASHVSRLPDELLK